MRATLLWIAALTAAAAAEPVRIPLYRRSNDGIVKAAADELDNGMLGGTVSIGNPPQDFTMAFDTSTGYSWVRTSRCKTENCLDRCTYYARRSSTAVSTGQKVKVKYDHGVCVDTTVYLDTVRFSGIEVANQPFGGAYRMTGFEHGFDGYFGLGRNIDFNRTQVYANGMDKRDLPSSAFVNNAYQSGSGLESSQFGMVTTDSSDSGFGQSGSVSSTDDTTTTTTTTTTVTDGTTNSTATATASSTDSGASTSTSTTATDNDSSSSDDTEVTSGGFGFVKRHSDTPAGYLILGGVDKSAIEGDVSYIPLASDSSNWDVPIKKVTFGDKLELKQEKHAVATVSTSESLILMPADQADAYHAKFGGKFLQRTGTYKVKCSKIKDMPTLKIYLGDDHIVELPPQYYTRVINADRDCCATRLSRSDSESDWVLGTSFTNNFYTTFDSVEETLGLALKKGHKQDGLKIYKRA
ncbi:aspartic peptidase domain-containing protein [Syncephalastrum racemosum]|uniref:Aspartic peptidase domain-containing protein n=1 Tax=Syncephalastrum racemosum TaxID=13706 RepID=A0A1X2HNR6_SYNRA|nr:aspartic peptidase domain-containing protein [Syncephalastrum racemosum]